MSRLPRNRIASAATVALLPALVLAGNVPAGASVATASSAPSSAVYSAAPAAARALVGYSVTRKKWRVMHRSPRSAAQAETIWYATASFRAVKRHPWARLQIRQIVDGRVKLVRTRAVRTGSSWKNVRVAVNPVNTQSSVQVLVRRKARAGVRVKNVRVVAAKPANVVVVPRPEPTEPSTPVPTVPVPTVPVPTVPVPTVPVPTVPSVPGWGTPDWQDEFTGTKVDPTKWNVRDRSNLGLTMDSAIPDAGQVSVNSGILHLKGDWLPETQTRTTSATGVNVLTHKTGYLDQRKIQSDNVYRGQRWGRWEIRAKTPTGTNTMGALAAFWLRNANSGEIDIMEAWGYGTAMPTAGKVMQDNAATTIHTKTDGTGVKRLWRHKELGSTSAPHDGFHVYAFELMPTYAAMYVDGKQIMRTTPAEYPDLWNTTYFGSPLHMRLNLHVGPDPRYWGTPDPLKRWLTGPLDYQVDYVRTWNAPS